MHTTATLGSTAQNRNDPICVVPPKVAKASTMASFVRRCNWRYPRRNIANVNTAYVVDDETK